MQLQYCGTGNIERVCTILRAVGLAVCGKILVEGLGTDFEASEGYDKSLTFSRESHSDVYCKSRNICVSLDSDVRVA